MIYYTKRTNKENSIIEKYAVSFDEEEVKNIRTEIINNCSMILHYDYCSTVIPNYFDSLKIRNFLQEKVGIKKYNNMYHLDDNIYHFVYDKYVYPYLVKLIDELLNNNSDVIDEIMTPNLNKETSRFNKAMEDVYDSTIKSNSLNAKDKLTVLNKLQVLATKSPLNDSQKPVEDYYVKVRELLNFELIDSIDLSLITRVKEFIGAPIDEQKKASKNIQKVLK